MLRNEHFRNRLGSFRECEKTVDFSKRKNNFTERSFIKKTNEIEGEISEVLRTNELNFFELLKKTNEMDRSQTMNKQNEKRTRKSISSYRMYQNTRLQNIQKYEATEFNRM